jgi:putative nucleotidyltransferase with HDIG domain
MVRLARFAAVLDATPDERPKPPRREMADELATISAERIRDELVKLVTRSQPRQGLELLNRTGLDRHVLPELEVLRDCVDPIHRHKDVYAHTLAVVENAMELEGDEPDFVLRFAALMHDVGKPDTREIHDDGTVTFHHHDVVGARMTRQRMRELRFDKETIARRRAAGADAPAVPHLQDGLDRLRRAALRQRRRAPARQAQRADPRRRDHPQPEEGRSHPTARRRARGAGRELRSRRSSTRCVRRSTATRSCRTSASRPGPRSATRGRSCWTSGSSTARCRRRRPGGAGRLVGAAPGADDGWAARATGRRDG